MSFCFPVRLAPRASAAPQLLAKIFRAIPPVSVAAIPVPVSSGPSAAATADVIAVAAVVQTAVAAVPIVGAQTVVQIAAAVRAARDSNAGPVVQAVRATIVVTAIPARHAGLNSSAKC
jgi:hypothetical protein